MPDKDTERLTKRSNKDESREEECVVTSSRRSKAGSMSAGGVHRRRPNISLTSSLILKYPSVSPWKALSLDCTIMAELKHSWNNRSVLLSCSKKKGLQNVNLNRMHPPCIHFLCKLISYLFSLSMIRAWMLANTLLNIDKQFPDSIMPTLLNNLNDFTFLCLKNAELKEKTCSS